MFDATVIKNERNYLPGTRSGQLERERESWPELPTQRAGGE